MNNIKNLIKRIGENYIKTENDCSALTLLNYERKNVLKGCNVLFTGVIQKGCEPQTTPMWNDVEYFGGKCYEKYDKNIITHIICGKMTDKVLLGKTDGKFTVTLNWLECSLDNWIKADEKLFDINIIS